MKKLQKLTVNGETYQVSDPDAITGDKLSASFEPLAEDQKEKIRQDLGTADSGQLQSILETFETSASHNLLNPGNSLDGYYKASIGADLVKYDSTKNVCTAAMIPIPAGATMLHVSTNKDVSAWSDTSDRVVHIFLCKEGGDYGTCVSLISTNLKEELPSIDITEAVKNGATHFHVVTGGNWPNEKLSLSNFCVSDKSKTFEEYAEADGPARLKSKYLPEGVVMKESLPGLINAKDYASGDGETDDTEGLRTALKVLKDAKGGELYIPKGIYRVSKTLYVPANTVVRGCGASSVIKLAPNHTLDGIAWHAYDRNPPKYPIVATDGYDTDSGVTASNIVIRDITIHGDEEAPSENSQAGLMIRANDCLVENVRTYAINYFPDTFLQRTGANAPGYGIFVFGGGPDKNDKNAQINKRINIVGCICDRNGYEGIGTDSCADVVISNCFVGDGNRTGIQVHRDSRNVKIIDCTVDNKNSHRHADITMHARADKPIISVQISGCTLKENYYNPYVETSETYDSGADTYLEKAESGYYLCTEETGRKMYLNLIVRKPAVKGEDYVAGEFQEDAVTVYTYDGIKKTLIANVNGVDYAFGTPADKKLTYVMPYAQIDGTSYFYCKFCTKKTVESEDPDTGETITENVIANVETPEVNTPYKFGIEHGNISDANQAAKRYYLMVGEMKGSIEMVAGHERDIIISSCHIESPTNVIYNEGWNNFAGQGGSIVLKGNIMRTTALSAHTGARCLRLHGDYIICTDNVIDSNVLAISTRSTREPIIGNNFFVKNNTHNKVITVAGS